MPASSSTTTQQLGGGVPEHQGEGEVTCRRTREEGREGCFAMYQWIRHLQFLFSENEKRKVCFTSPLSVIMAKIYQEGIRFTDMKCCRHHYQIDNHLATLFLSIPDTRYLFMKSSAMLCKLSFNIKYFINQFSVKCVAVIRTLMCLGFILPGKCLTDTTSVPIIVFFC